MGLFLPYKVGSPFVESELTLFVLFGSRIIPVNRRCYYYFYMVIHIDYI